MDYAMRQAGQKGGPGQQSGGLAVSLYGWMDGWLG